MTCWPQLSESFCPISREKKSALPPAGNGTTMRTGLTGKFCALTAPARKIASNNARGRQRTPMRDKTVDRKSTRLNSSHANISYAVFCLKKKKRKYKERKDQIIYVKIVIRQI